MLLASTTVPITKLQDIVEDIRRDEARAGEVIRRFCELLCQHDFHYQSLNINDVATAAAAIAALRRPSEACTSFSIYTTRPALYGATG